MPTVDTNIYHEPENENRVQEVSRFAFPQDYGKNYRFRFLFASFPGQVTSDKRPMLSDLRESGAIEQDADIIMFLYREDYYDEDTDRRNIAECIVAKNRHGNTGTIELQWVPQYTVFASRDRIHSED